MTADMSQLLGVQRVDFHIRFTAICLGRIDGLFKVGFAMFLWLFISRIIFQINEQTLTLCLDNIIGRKQSEGKGRGGERWEYNLCFC